MQTFTVNSRFFLQVTMTAYSLFITCNNLFDSSLVKKVKITMFAYNYGLKWRKMAFFTYKKEFYSLIHVWFLTIKSQTGWVSALLKYLKVSLKYGIKSEFPVMSTRNKNWNHENKIYNFAFLLRVTVTVKKLHVEKNRGLYGKSDGPKHPS